MAKQYEITRSATNRQLLLIYAAGEFENLPFEVRLHAPWVGCDPVALDSLKAEQRVEIARHGYAIVRGAAVLSNAA